MRSYREWWHVGNHTSNGEPRVSKLVGLPFPAQLAYRSRMVGDQVEQTERAWPDPDRGPWRLILWWARDDGRLHVTGLKLEPIEAGRDTILTTSTLRDLRLSEVAAEERMKLARQPVEARSPEVVLAGMRPGTARRLTLAAQIYREAWEAGGNPRQAVAERMNVSPGAAANLISRARAAGLLPPTSSGVPMG